MELILTELAAETFQIVFTLSIVTLLIVFLTLDRFKMSLLFISAVILLIVGRVLSIDEFLQGFSNNAIITIFLLIIITSAINQHFNLFRLLDRFFKKIKTARSFILKMGGLVALLSSLINNTTVVATMMPYVYSWGNRNNISPSKLLIPLSYMAIVGGMITLIGTSTNLLLNGLLIANGQEALVFSDFFFPGILVSLAVIFFLFLFGPALLKNKANPIKGFKENTREYLVEIKVLSESPIIDLTVEQAGLRNLEGVFLTEILRDSKRIVAVGPKEIIEKGDILLFAGETSKILELLEEGSGLELSQLEDTDVNTDIVEAVIAQNSALDRKTLKEAGFREKYNAAVVGVHRKGVKLRGKIGSIPLHTGDLVLISGGTEFKEKNNRLQDLIVISTVFSGQQISSKKRKIFLGSLLAILTVILCGFVNLLEGLLILMFVQTQLGMLDYEKIKKNVSLELLIVLTSSLAIGSALINSGSSEFLTQIIFDKVSLGSPVLLFITLFAITFTLTSFITNVAALSIVFPIVLSLTEISDIPVEPLFLTIAFAASCSFLTPFAYQTNLMVAEAGNYKLKDFFKIGLPLSFVYAGVFLGYIFLRYNII